jgi:hypothetical protein
MSVLKKISIVASVIGILTGLDLLSGARITTTLRQMLDKVTINIDEAMIAPKARIILGILFLVLSVLMILLLVIS